MFRVLLVAIVCLASQVQADDIPLAKQTSLGLYLTSAEAYDKWHANPEGIKVLDVRTVEEYVFVGHATMSTNIPFAFQTHEWVPGSNRLAMKPNPDFLALVKEWARPSETILVMCRSGGRSAMAVNALAQAGYKHVYNIIDGMEGDRVKDADSPDFGKRTKSGWKNAGLPWTYDLDPAKMRL
jgi:rhodanese-related sulfurtransferase